MPFKYHKRCAPLSKVKDAPRVHEKYRLFKIPHAGDDLPSSRSQGHKPTPTWTPRVKQHPARPPGATILHQTHLTDCSKKNLWAPFFFFFRCENHRLVFLVPWPTARLFLVFDFVACLSFYVGEKYRTLAWRLGHLHFFLCSRGLTHCDGRSFFLSLARTHATLAIFIDATQADSAASVEKSPPVAEPTCGPPYRLPTLLVVTN